MKVSFKNTKTGELRQVKVGFSWVLLLFSGFLGIPLFLRRMHIWGAVFLALWALNFLVVSILPEGDASDESYAVLMLIMIGLQIYMGIKGNELTAKNYLENGWEFSDELNNDATVKFAKTQWRLA